MIFKTLNGDLTVFNKTLISTKDHLKSLQAVNATVHNKNGAFNLQGLLVNSSQSISTFTKLSNAFKAYNGNLSKSTQLQNAYVQAVGKQNITLGNYLAGLNGAKASMGGYVKSLVAAKAASIKLQAASIALNTAISMGITLTISALISAITKWANKEKEAREEAIENAKAAKEEANNLSELLNKYNQLSKEVKSNQGVKEDLLSVQSDLLETLGIEASQIDTLIEKYGDLNSAINQITLDSLRDAQGDLMVAIETYEKDLIKVGKDYAHWYSFTDRNLLSTGQSSTDALGILEKAGIISSGSHGEGGGALVLTGNDKTVEGILENYQQLKDAQEALNTAIDNGEITMEEMIKIPLYNDINSRLDELEESIGNYNTAIADLNKNMAQQQILKSLAEQSSIPETKEEFDAFQQSMIDTAIASTKFKGSQDDIGDSIINVLSVMPEFKKYFEELNDVQDSTSNIENPISLSISETIDQLNTQLKPTFDALKSAYQDIFTTDDNGQPLFTLENVDLSMLDSIKSKLDELNKLEGVNLNIDYTSFENLARVLTDTTSTADDVQTAFNSLATDIVSALNPAISECSGENYKLVQSLLESVGIMNSEEVMVSSLGYTYEEYIAAKEEAADAGFDLANATESEIDAFVREALESGNCGQALALLQLKKLLVNSTVINTAANVQQIMNLASAAGMGAEVLTQLANAKSILGTVESGGTVSLNSYQKALDDVQSAKQTILDWKPVEVDFGNIGGGKKSAGSAGKEAADAYLESFEKELKDLDDLKDHGRISEKQYLDALRRLYLKYFRDKEKYLKEYEKYENQYLDGMKSLYESAFSYITKQIDKRIDAIHAEKDAAVSRLEAERDASLEAIEAEKKQHENEIGSIEKQIDAKEKEIKAMQDANAERRRAIDLQKAEYELQRMQNQKTSLVYKDGQMSYETDTSGIRDAKQEVDDAKLEIDISKIEEEISLLEDEKDLIQERIDLLDKEADRISQYYDKLIADTEKHYDAMAKGLEDYKAQFGELTELLETAQMEATLSELGISMDALLSGSQEEFEKLKTAYTGILADMGRGNDGVLDQLSRLSGISTESISYLDATRGAFEGLGGVTLEGLEESVDGIGEFVSTLSTSAGEASAAVGNIQESVSGASQSIAPLNTELGNLKTLIGELIELLSSIQFPEIGGEGYVQKLRDTAQAFGEIASKCAEFQNIDFSSIIGSASVSGVDSAAMPGGEGAEGQTGTGFMGLASAISEAATAIDEQMDRLKKALDTGNDAFTEQIRIIHEEYIPAWEELQTRLAEIIGVGGGNGDNKEGEGKQKSGNKGRSSESGRNDGSIIDIMQTGGEEVAKKLEDPWLKAFHDFATDGDNSVQSICDKIIELVTEMARIIQEQCEAAANSLRSLAETAASSLSSAGGSGSVSRNTVSGNTIPVFPKAEGTVGNAFAKGTGKYKGLPHNEKNALRSEYGQPELTVYPDGKAELTTEPVISNLPKGTVIFNEEQTRRIMENKGEMIGHAYDGETITLLDGRKIRPLNSSDEPYWMQKKLESYFAENRDAFLRPGNAMSKAAESMDRAAETIHNNHVMKQSIHVDVGGVHVHGVQNPEEFSDVVNLRIHNKILQEINKW